MATVESQNTKLQLGDGGAPETFSDIGEVTGVTGFRGGQATVIDVSTLASSRREKRMGLADEGQVTVNLQYDPSDAQQSALETARANRSLLNFKLVLSNTPATEFAFSAYVLTFPVNVAVDTVVQGSITLEISGDVVKT